MSHAYPSDVLTHTPTRLHRRTAPRVASRSKPLPTLRQLRPVARHPTGAAFRLPLVRSGPTRRSLAGTRWPRFPNRSSRYGCERFRLERKVGSACGIDAGGEPATVRPGGEIRAYER